MNTEQPQDLPVTVNCFGCGTRYDPESRPDRELHLAHCIGPMPLVQADRDEWAARYFALQRLNEFQGRTPAEVPRCATCGAVLYDDHGKPRCPIHSQGVH